MHAEHVPSPFGVHPFGALTVADTHSPSTGTNPLLHLLQYLEPPMLAVHCPSAQFSAYLPVHSGMHVPAVEPSLLLKTDPG